MVSIRGNKPGSMALALSVLLTYVIVFDAPVHSAVPHKRSIAQRETANDLETCRSDGICGWEVYDRYSRDPLYYVASLCRCSTEETCIRTGDDVSSFSYVYRCRVVRRNKHKNRTTSAATNGPNSTAASSS